MNKSSNFIEYQEIDLDKIIQYFANDFVSKEGVEIYNKEWFVDIKQGKVIYKLFCSKKGK